MDNAFTEKLRAQGYRITPQRWVILNILQNASGHLTPVEICRQAQVCMPGLTEATVYRTLNFLTDQGLLLAAHIGSGQLVYEKGEYVHHHLICRSCGQSMQIDHELLQDLYKVFQAHTGYLIDSIHTTFFGLCPHCQLTEIR